MVGSPAAYDGVNADSKNDDKDSMFNSPDGLASDNNGLLRIQTDGNYSNQKELADQGDDQMPIGDPASGEIRRLVVGQKQCNVTDIACERAARIVGIQHPKARQPFSRQRNTVPRHSVIAITRDEGGCFRKNFPRRRPCGTTMGHRSV